MTLLTARGSLETAKPVRTDHGDSAPYGVMAYWPARHRFDALGAPVRCGELIAMLYAPLRRAMCCVR